MLNNLIFSFINSNLHLKFLFQSKWHWTHIGMFRMVCETIAVGCIHIKYNVFIDWKKLISV